MKNPFNTACLVLLLILTSSAGSFAGDTAKDYYDRGNTKSSKGDLDGAIADYNHAIEIDPKLSAAYVERGYVKQDKGDLDGAIADYTRAIELDPNYSYAYTERGYAMQDKGDLDGAIADFSRAIEINPKNSEAFCYRGYARKAKRDLDEAITDFSRAIEIDPKYSTAYCFRGTAKKDKGDQDGAIADFNKAIEINPKEGGGYCGRGVSKLAIEDLDGAIADFNQAIKIDPKYSRWAYRFLAGCKYLKSNWKDALSDYRRVIELAKKGSDQDYSQLFIWIIRTRIGEKEAADKELTERLAKGWNAAPNDWLSKVAGHLLGTVTEADLLAAADSPDARKKSGQICEAWYYIGMKKLLTGDKKSAADDFRKCLDTKRDDFTEFKFAQAELKALGGL